MIGRIRVGSVRSVKSESLMMSLVASFLRDESGATVVEYGLIAALIAVGIIASATAIGLAINTSFQGIADDNFTEDPGEVGQN